MCSQQHTTSGRPAPRPTSPATARACVSSGHHTSRFRHGALHTQHSSQRHRMELAPCYFKRHNGILAVTAGQGLPDAMPRLCCVSAVCEARPAACASPAAATAGCVRPLAPACAKARATRPQVAMWRRPWLAQCGWPGSQLEVTLLPTATNFLHSLRYDLACVHLDKRMPPQEGMEKKRSSSC